MRKMKDCGVTWLGKIPADWELIKIKYISQSNLEVLPENYDAETEIKYVDIGSVTYEAGINQVQTFKFSDAPSRARRILHNGDTIISTVRTYLKAISYIDDTFDKHIGSTGFSVITPIENIHKKFLYYALSSHSFISEVEANSVGISYPAITNTNLINLKIALPSLTKQYSIAEYLDKKCSKINSIIEKQQSVIVKLKEYKSSIITEAVTKGLCLDAEMRDSGIEWIGKIPVDWELQRLRFLCDIQTGNMDTQNNNPNGKYPFYVRSPKVEYSDSYTFDNEAVLMAGDGVGAGRVFHYVNGKYGCHQRVYSMSNFIKLKGKYLYYYLLENFYKKIEENNAKSTVDSVRLPMLKDFVVAFPNNDEQEKIVSYLDQKCIKIDPIITKRQAVIEKLKAYKKSLIYEVVTGKKEV